MARVIIAEDDDLVGEIARDAPIGAGHHVGLLANGKGALAVIRHRQPDLVIRDCNIPDVSGLLMFRVQTLLDKYTAARSSAAKR